MDRPFVIAVGNPMRSDDGAGARVLELIWEDFETRLITGDCAQLIDLWSGRENVIIVDAAKSGAPIGIIHKFDAIKAEIPRGCFIHTSHEFGVAEAVEMARILGQLPERLYVFGIEGRNFGYSEILSPEVEEACKIVADLILKAN